MLHLFCPEVVWTSTSTAIPPGRAPITAMPMPAADALCRAVYSVPRRMSTSSIAIKATDTPIASRS